jgi:hypothetical protein
MFFDTPLLSLKRKPSSLLNNQYSVPFHPSCAATSHTHTPSRHLIPNSSCNTRAAAAVARHTAQGNHARQRQTRDDAADQQQQQQKLLRQQQQQHQQQQQQQQIRREEQRERMERGEYGSQSSSGGLSVGLPLQGAGGQPVGFARCATAEGVVWFVNGKIVLFLVDVCGCVRRRHILGPETDKQKKVVVVCVCACVCVCARALTLNAIAGA